MIGRKEAQEAQETADRKAIELLHQPANPPKRGNMVGIQSR